MTLEQLFVRFLKDNGLYAYRKERVLSRIDLFRRYGYKITEEEKSFVGAYKTNYIFRQKGPLFLFTFVFRDDRLFSGNHHSSDRRKYYQLNRKWKELLRNRAVIQCNIKPGDTITYKSMWGKDSKRCVVCKHLKDDTGTKCCVSYGQNRYHNIGYCSLFAINEVNEQKPIINIYFKVLRPYIIR